MFVEIDFLAAHNQKIVLIDVKLLNLGSCWSFFAPQTNSTRVVFVRRLRLISSVDSFHTGLNELNQARKPS